MPVLIPGWQSLPLQSTHLAIVPVLARSLGFLPTCLRSSRDLHLLRLPSDTLPELLFLDLKTTYLRRLPVSNRLLKTLLRETICFRRMTINAISPQQTTAVDFILIEVYQVIRKYPTCKDCPPVVYQPHIVGP